LKVKYGANRWRLQESEKLSDLDLLKVYAKQWDQYTVGASYINKLFNYLNKHWVKREKDEGRKEVYTVYTVRPRCSDKAFMADETLSARPSSMEAKLLQASAEFVEWYQSADASFTEANRAAEKWRGG